ncbi:MAG: hypothetical protein GIKADHBN_02745 [Phycisphaerales bacterium]|nr:hypothetical protein [Phycisphaerales bacterium]
MAKRPSPASAFNANHRVILLKGPDAFLRWLRTNEVRKVLTAAHGSFDTFQFDGDTAKVTEVLDECRTFGLMAGHKLVIVDNADRLIKAASDEDEANTAPRPTAGRRTGPAIDTSPRGLLTRYAQQPAQDATLILRAATWRPGNLDKAIEEQGLIVACDELKEPQAAAWAVERATTEHKVTLTPQAASVLVERLGCDLGRIDGEIAKLAVQATVLADNTDAGTISPEMVAASVGFTREEETWGFQRLLLTSDTASILENLYQVIEISRQPMTQVAWACTDLARKFHAVCAAARAGVDPHRAAGAAKLWGEMQGVVASLAPRFSPAVSAKLLAACVEADARQKSGLADPQRSLESLAIKFSRLRPATGR